MIAELQVFYLERECDERERVTGLELGQERRIIIQKRRSNWTLTEALRDLDFPFI